ncbi:MAG: adenine phosphoribosyltransferase [Veillonellales bacterium]
MATIRGDDAMNYGDKIRTILGFPGKGVSFKDITTLLKEGTAFHQAIAEMARPFKETGIDVVVGPEARGFAIGAPVAFALQAGFIPIRKPGKLPAATLKYSYDLEYGKDSLEIHQDAIQPGQKVLIVDDLLATGGTTQAAIHLVEQLGGKVAGLSYLIELSYLGGRQLLSDYNIVSLVIY